MKLVDLFSRSTTNEIRRRVAAEHSIEKAKNEEAFQHLHQLMDATLAALAKNPDASPDASQDQTPSKDTDKHNGSE